MPCPGLHVITSCCTCCTVPIGSNGGGSGEKSLLEAYQSLYESGQGSDLILVVGEREFPVHKNILAVRSDSVFASLQLKNSKVINRIVFTDIEVDVLDRLLRYLYYDKVPTDVDDSDSEEEQLIRKLAIASEKFQLDRLYLIHYPIPTTIQNISIGNFHWKFPQQSPQSVFIS